MNNKNLNEYAEESLRMSDALSKQLTDMNKYFMYFAPFLTYEEKLKIVFEKDPEKQKNIAFSFCYNKLKESQDQKETTHNQMEMLQNQVEKLQQEILELKKKNKELNNDIEKERKYKNELQEKNTNLMNEKNELIKESDKNTETIKFLKEKNDILRDENSNYKLYAKIDEVGKQLLERDYSKLNIELINAKFKNICLKSENKSLNNELNKANNENILLNIKDKIMSEKPNIYNILYTKSYKFKCHMNEEDNTKKHIENDNEKTKYLKDNEKNT